MDASPLRTMTFGTQSHPRREPCARHHHTLDRHQVHRARRRAPAGPPPVQGLQAQDLGPGPLVAPAGRRRPDHLAVRRLPAPRRRPLRRDGPQGACWPPCPTTPTCNGSSTAPWPGTCPRRCAGDRQRLAIDLTLIPYHGQPSATPTRSTAARPRTAPATSTPTPPPTSSARGSASPWP